MCWICYNFLLKPLHHFIKDLNFPKEGFRIVLSCEITLQELNDFVYIVKKFIDEWNNHEEQNKIDKILNWIIDSFCYLQHYAEEKQPLFDVLKTVISLEEVCMSILLFCITDFRITDRQHGISDFKTWCRNVLPKFDHVHTLVSLNTSIPLLIKKSEHKYDHMKSNCFYITQTGNNGKIKINPVKNTDLLICFNCCGPGGKFEIEGRCSQCKLAVYCSKECQKQDWKDHKELCLIFKNMMEDESEKKSRDHVMNSYLKYKNGKMIEHHFSGSHEKEKIDYIKIINKILNKRLENNNNKKILLNK